MDLHENLKGKTVVITGGSGILCREFAYAYAKQGMNVAVLGRTLSKLEEVRDKINELGGNGLAVVALLLQRTVHLQHRLLDLHITVITDGKYSGRLRDRHVKTPPC